MKYVFALFVVIAGISCSPRLSPDAGWGRQRWVVVEMKGVPVQQSGGRRDAYISFETAEKRFTGNGGCNTINGNYTIEKKTLRFTDISSTKMSCEDIAFENTFLATLNQVNRFEMLDNSMLLKNDNKVILIFQRR